MNNEPTASGEPVAYMSYEDLEEWKDGLIENAIVYKNHWEETFPLYTAPQPHPADLTDEEIEVLARKHLCYQIEGSEVSGVFNFARAILRKAQEK